MDDDEGFPYQSLHSVPRLKREDWPVCKLVRVQPYNQIQSNNMTTLPDWPPSLPSAETEAALLHLARDYALSHSLIYRPALPQSSSDTSTFHTTVTHAPFSLFPSPFPAHLFTLATEIQKSYNALYVAIASDFGFLQKVVGGNVALVDEFQGELWRIAKLVREEGIVQVGLCLSVCILRKGVIREGVTDREIHLSSSSLLHSIMVDDYSHSI